MKQTRWKLWTLAAFLLWQVALIGCASPMGASLYLPDVAETTRTAQSQANNRFALDLLRQLQESTDKGNLFFSPYSLSTALTMTYAGARGKTAAQMRQVLQLQQADEEVHKANAYLMLDLRNRGYNGAYRLSIANQLWGAQDEVFLTPFLGLLQEQYQATMEQLDFAGNTEQARKRINDWASQQTDGKIKEVLKEGIIDGNTRLVLTNAIHFQGLWATRFRKEETVTEDFFVTQERSVRVPMMKQALKAGYLKEGNLQLLSLDYQGNDTAMVLLMPAPGELQKLIAKLSTTQLDSWLGRMNEDKVEVSLPRFQLRQDLDMNKTLQSMGMTDAFSSAADFSGMNGKKDLFIKAVLHKAVLSVDEEGSEASGVTTVVVNRKSASGGDPLTFVANRPFVLMIRDKKSGAILFLGQVTIPTQAP